MNTQISFGIFVLLIPVLLAESTKKQNVSKMEVNSELEVPKVTTETNVAQTGLGELECFDLYETKKCEELRDDWKLCENAKENHMNEMCKKTCGFCKANNDCTSSKFQCCEDGITPKDDLHGSNCPECRDKHSVLCQKYARDCNGIGWAGLWMEANCRKTCQYCKEIPPPCSDDKEQQQFCSSWKLYGMCDKHGSLMKKHCAKTCGFCDQDKEGGSEEGEKKLQSGKTGTQQRQRKFYFPTGKN